MAITKIKTENREEWKKLRSNYIGGSDAATVIGINPWSSPYALWAEKTGKTEGFAGNIATEVGTYLEEFVAQKWADETGEKVHRENMSILNDDYPWAIANIDRKVVGKDEGLECKTCSELRTKEFKDGEFPDNYYVQCQHYMMVTGYKMWHLAVLIGNKDFKIFDIPRDDEEIEALADMEQKFWEHVTSNTPPEVDGSEATTEAIKAIYVCDNGEKIDMPNIEGLLDERAQLDESIKALKERKDAIENDIKTQMGEYTGAYAGPYSISWKAQSRKTYDVAAFLNANPTANFGPYTKITESRVFRVNKSTKKEK